MDWIYKLFNKSNVEYTPLAKKKYILNIQFKTANLNTTKLVEILAQEGYEVSVLSIDEQGKEILPGSEIKLLESILVTEDALVKTSTRCLIFPEIIAPIGIVGKVQSIEDNTACVLFDHPVKAKAIDYMTGEILEDYYSIHLAVVPLVKMQSL